jgi:hypothetical protein
MSPEITEEQMTYEQQRDQELAREEMWQIVADIRDQHPRHPEDVDTWDIVDALFEAGFRKKTN